MTPPSDHPTPTTAPDWLTTEQVAAWIGVSRRTVDNMRASGRLDGSYFVEGAVVRFEREALRRVLLHGRAEHGQGAATGRDPVPAAPPTAPPVAPGAEPGGWIVAGSGQRMTTAERRAALRAGRVLIDPGAPGERAAPGLPVLHEGAESAPAARRGRGRPPRGNP